ncbi:DUF4438 domain-containing protein [Plantibacter sp. lyk4-40-MEA-4]|uniref:DUF4438 family protein n=1 Tax=Plantibacter sp. lyk4-40-MEA-4 TaxID=3040298 RepID=UPI00254E2F0A|nr:DUF4438 domain-containing protein [Plantibacter sp. lyk4-40-MEA-4]
MSSIIANNLLGFVEHAGLTPMVSYRIDRDGHPYLPIGDGGVVLGVHLGDSVFATDADHAAPGVTLVHPDPGSRFGLTSFACVGNRATVRSGAAMGATGSVVGKRGEAGRVIVSFDDETMAALLPGDRIAVHAMGQGLERDDLPEEIVLLNIDPALLAALPLTVEAGVATVDVVGVLPGKVAGNGIGRPAHQWDVDLAVTPDSPELAGIDMRLGDLFAVEHLDVRHNMGFRRDWITVGIIVHGGSPMPGHGPGFLPIACGPRRVLQPRATPGESAAERPALTSERLAAVAPWPTA